MLRAAHFHRLSVAALFLGVVLAGAWCWHAWRPRPPLEQARRAARVGDWAAAAKASEAELLARPSNTKALRLLARANFELARFQDSWAAYRRLGPAMLDAGDLQVLGLSLAKVNNLVLARVALETARMLDPDDSAVRAALTMRGNAASITDAADVSARMRGLNSASARAALVLGMLDPADPRGGPPERQADALLRAFDQEPFAFASDVTRDRAAELLARALLCMGRYEDALEPLDGLLAGSSDRTALWLRSRAWLGMGRMDRASQDLELAGGPHLGENIEFEPAPFVGSNQCGTCHATHFESQQTSRHARSFPTLEQVCEMRLPSSPVTDPSDDNVSHAFDCTGSTIETITRVGDREFRALVKYAFGSGRRGITLVGADERGGLRELRLSHYAGLGWDRTTGHPVRPERAEDYAGRVLSWNDVHNCLSCHTTEIRSARDRSGPTAADGGIGCERCHGPGGNHVKAAEARFSDMAIALPSGARAAEISRLCGQCHKPRGAAMADALSGPSAARFQAAALPLSRCYNPKSSALSCVTCHNPHRDVRTSAEHYDSKCLSCHYPDQDIANNLGGERRQSRTCPVNPERDCVSCHMPKVAGPMAHTAFTDHRIQVPRDPPVPGVEGTLLKTR